MAYIEGALLSDYKILNDKVEMMNLENLLISFMKLLNFFALIEI
jgi:hypothetical protein